MIGHECGLMGIYGHEEASRLIYFGLYAQQHRGQESAGIVTYDEGQAMHEHKGMGLVPEVFTEDALALLKGKTGIGHVRYSTTGKSSAWNAQPFLVHFQGEDIALAHNGNLVNTMELRDALEADGGIFTSTNDTEVIMHLLVRSMRTMSLENAVRHTCSQLKGAYCLLIMARNKLIAVRDPHGLHPLAVGELDGSYVFASETCAFDLLEAEYIRTVEPNEMIIVEDGDMRSMPLSPADKPCSIKPKQCIFELVYFARPDSLIYDEQVYSCRKLMGKYLAQEAPADVDFVMPFPDSGIYSALGFCQEANLPYEHAMIRNHYVGRTFIQPTQSMRSFSVRVKINPIRSIIEGKRICIIDDSIVRGTTMITRVKKLRELGAKEVHIRISSPPVKFPCYYGVDFANPDQLIAANYSMPEIVDQLNVDSLHYISIEGLLKTVRHPECYCTACFSGEYPVPCSGLDKHRLESCSKR
ncbi:MAG: amidophosphoribosyltransferase [Desulfovibrionaceae bacterium]|jgi:amidophosphoribosyltransferase|nr:amidophosphoribosyltransferase [Desulfovibrionaceae bacterium]